MGGVPDTRGRRNDPSYPVARLLVCNLICVVVSDLVVVVVVDMIGGAIFLVHVVISVIVAFVVVVIYSNCRSCSNCYSTICCSSSCDLLRLNVVI